MQTDECIADEEAFIESRTGVRQGDPLAALLFSLAMHPVYDCLAKKVSAGCYAYIDDGHFLGTMEECWSVWQSLPALLSPLGLSINPSKCELTCFTMQHISRHVDKEALGRFQSSPLRINDSTLSLLGCVVAVDTSAAAHALLHRATLSPGTGSDANNSLRVAQQTALRRIPLLRKQTAMLALQRLSGLVINNQLRAMPPASVSKHAKRYDTEVMQVAHTIIGITKEDEKKYDAQIQSPLSVGGFGLTSAESIAAPAYIAGAETTLRCSPAFANIWAGNEPLPRSSPTYQAIEDSIKRITRDVSDLIHECDPKYINDHLKDISSLLPNSADSFVSYFKVRQSPVIQSSLTHRITTLSFIARVSAAVRTGKAGQRTIARLQSLLETGSALWLQTLPTEAALTLTDNKWRWAARLRLDMPVPVAHSACDRCKCANAYTADSWHALSCTALSGRAMTDRHNDVVLRLAQFATLAQFNNRVEPATLDHDSKKRPDIQVALPDTTLLGDVTIAHPMALSWRRKVSKEGAQAVGDMREKTKQDLYAEMAAANDMKFVALVFYTHGGFHRSAIHFIQRLTSALDPVTCLLSRSDFNVALKQHIAIAIQRGNAAIMMQDEYRQRDLPTSGCRFMQIYKRIRDSVNRCKQVRMGREAAGDRWAQCPPRTTLSPNTNTNTTAAPLDTDCANHPVLREDVDMEGNMGESTAAASAPTDHEGRRQSEDRDGGVHEGQGGKADGNDRDKSHKTEPPPYLVGVTVGGLWSD
ncbi:MAG: reverse transcriptase domain-containing protein [Acetobacteraceae bacterium]